MMRLETDALDAGFACSNMNPVCSGGSAILVLGEIECSLRKAKTTGQLDAALTMARRRSP